MLLAEQLGAKAKLEALMKKNSEMMGGRTK
jgi:hypothetical protein